MIQNPERLKIGTRRDDGMILAGYQGKNKKEWWTTPEKFLQLQEKRKQYRKSFKEKNPLYFLEWQKQNKEKCSEYGKKWYFANPEKVKAKKERYKNEKPNYGKEYQYKRRNSDSLYRISSNIRSMISNCLKEKGFKKRPRTQTILGCTFKDFHNHIENQFKEGMTWQNRNLWHLDHIIPLASAKSEKELINLNHYTNFQPLWALENMKKSNKLQYAA
jgi:hypothetical protein